MGRRLVVILLAAIAACEAAQTDAPKTDAPKTTDAPPNTDAPEPEPPVANTCMPGGLEAASKVERVVLPRGCQIAARGSISAPAIVRSANELAEAIRCEPGSELPAIDFAEHQLHLANFMLSPAYAGSEVVDDGETVTFVQRDRSPCPGDPLPMPIGSSLAYLLPHGAERGYAQLSCTLPVRYD